MPVPFVRLARLNDVDIAGLSLEGRFDLAYYASHALCLAALRWHGYRANYRYFVFQVLPQTLDLGPEVWRILEYAEVVGWTIESCEKVENRRAGFPTRLVSENSGQECPRSFISVTAAIMASNWLMGWPVN